MMILRDRAYRRGAAACERERKKVWLYERRLFDREILALTTIGS
jgi:hypothetical protein